jgi:hypothetical protein
VDWVQKASLRHFIQKILKASKIPSKGPSVTFCIGDWKGHYSHYGQSAPEYPYPNYIDQIEVDVFVNRTHGDERRLWKLDIILKWCHGFYVVSIWSIFKSFFTIMLWKIVFIHPFPLYLWCWHLPKVKSFEISWLQQKKYYKRLILQRCQKKTIKNWK